MTIRRVLSIAAIVTCLEAVSAAQAPPPPPPGGHAGPEQAAAFSQFRWSAVLLIGLPQSDLADVADTSLGLRAELGYNINPNLSVHGAARFFLVNVDSDIEEFVDGVTYYDLALGGRYAFDLQSSSVRPFVDAELGYATVSVDSGGESQSESDPLLALRGGGTYAWRPGMDVLFFLGYTHIFTSDDGLGEDASAAWIELGGGVQGYF
jgi:hypothetical protein